MQVVEPKNDEAKVFKDREEVEILTLYDLGKDVELEAGYKGSKKIRVPRWSMRKAHKCSKAVAEIIAATYPNDLLFLYQLDYTKRADCAAKLHKILFFDIYDPAMQIICATLDITDKVEIGNLIDCLTELDVMEIFCTIIEQEINGARIEAIIKKFQRLLSDRFPLQNVSLGLQELLDLAREKLSTN